MGIQYHGTLELGLCSLQYDISVNLDASPSYIPGVDDEVKFMQSLFSIVIRKNDLEYKLSDEEYLFFNRLLVPFVEEYNSNQLKTGSIDSILHVYGSYNFDETSEVALAPARYPNALLTIQ